ncbi:MAG: hypothetical protein HC852_20935 [Acaryochloridaceae cyanobacterium RU_4_10]|nr:hypothetical protein [Acaryochloridaceae cyanobacterium RU_4_10]
MLSSSTADNLKLHLLLEQAQDGSAIATVLELPDCRIEAPTSELAIARLRNLVTHRLGNAQVLPLDISMPAAEGTENPWMKYAGVFKDDPYFPKIVETMQAERQDDAMDEALA